MKGKVFSILASLALASLLLFPSVGSAMFPSQVGSLSKDFIRLSECVPGHGFHYAKDPGRFGPPGSPQNPILLYYGEKVVAVEYVIPASISEKTPPKEAMRGPELHLGEGLHSGERSVNHLDLAYLPVFPPEKKDGIKAFTIHLWYLEHKIHEKHCK